MRGKFSSRRAGVLVVLGLSSLVSLGFFVVSAIHNHSLADLYLVWNLLLAWLPLLLAGWLVSVLRRYLWLSWRPLLLTFLWLGVLPNSFYLVSDLVHLQQVASANILYDSVMFESFIINGLLLGYLSVYLVHQQLLRRVSMRWASGLITLTLLICSFAIYLGRDLRWSSWDLLANPAGILFGVSNPVVDPLHNLQAFTTTLMFFVLIASLYFMIRSLARVLYRQPNKGSATDL